MNKKLVITDIPEYYMNTTLIATYKVWKVDENDVLHDIGIVGREELLDTDEKEKNNTVFGYGIEEMVFLAAACREAGITDKQLHDFVTNLEATVAWCREHYIQELNRITEEAIDDMLGTVKGEEND